MQGMRKRPCARRELSSENAQRPRNGDSCDLLGVRFNKEVSSGEGETSKKERLRVLKRESVAKEPTVWIGKNGITRDLLGQVSKQLEKREIVKVKAQKTSLEHSDVTVVADQIAGATGAGIVDIRGRTFTIYKQRIREQRRTRA